LTVEIAIEEPARVFHRQRGSSPRSLAAGIAGLALLLACTDASEPASEPAVPSPTPAATSVPVPVPDPVDREPPSEVPTPVVEPEPAPVAPAEPEPEPVIKGVRRGGVCRTGTRHAVDGDSKKHTSVHRDCRAGLQCCYPCGMAGCDWVCATQAECKSWRTLP
jgi:hypothetical protein